MEVVSYTTNLSDWFSSLANTLLPSQRLLTCPGAVIASGLPQDLHDSTFSVLDGQLSVRCSRVGESLDCVQSTSWDEESEGPG